MIIRIQKESEFTKGHFYIQHHILYYGAMAVAEISYEYNWKNFDTKTPETPDHEIDFNLIFSDIKNYILTISKYGNVPDIFILRYLNNCQPKKKFSKDSPPIEIITGNIISLSDGKEDDEETIEMIW